MAITVRKSCDTCRFWRRLEAGEEGKKSILGYCFKHKELHYEDDLCDKWLPKRGYGDG